jgi:hypothetical protein
VRPSPPPLQSNLPGKFSRVTLSRTTFLDNTASFLGMPDLTVLTQPEPTPHRTAGRRLPRRLPGAWSLALPIMRMFRPSGGGAVSGWG